MIFDPKRQPAKFALLDETREVGTQLSNFTHYATPNASSLPLIDLDLGPDWRVYDRVWAASRPR